MHASYRWYFLLYLPFKKFSFDHIYLAFTWFHDDGSPILDKQVTSNIIVGAGVGLWAGSIVTCFYIVFIYNYIMLIKRINE